LIILRDYGAEKKTRHCSILEFIELTSNSKYQLKPPKNAFEYLLLSGRLLVIFDGLDELLDTSYRREVSADVESFLALYPATAALVTSREVGYDQAPLDRKRFTAYRINEFDEHQVQEYAHKWFGIEDEFTPEQNESLAKNFLKESESVADLRSNPLILGLMCNIYRGESYIPRNRPGVYEKCALMLFDRWDRGRHLDVQFSFEDKLSPVMKYLAFWIYSDPKLQTGVTESSLIEKATEYLHKRLYDDIDFARKVAREFIEFCRGRAWVFTDTGSTADGELLYQFTHRTFLEYFTAAQLVRIYPRPSELAPVLIPRIEKEE
jgi:predicted NACHT family NTPase